MLTGSRHPDVIVFRWPTLGDMLTIVPPLRAIRRAFPGARVFLTTQPWLEPLVLHAGLADICVGLAPGVVPDPTDITLEMAQLGHLAGVPFGVDLAIHCRGYRPATYEPLLRLQPARLIAFRHPDVPASADGPIYDHHEHQISRWSRMMSQSGIACDPSEFAIDPPVIDLGALSGAIVVNPGAGARARYWPAERWAQVIHKLCASGRKVAVTGSYYEADWVGAIMAAADAPQAVNVCGRTSILELTALIAAAPLIVCPDTGVAHLATALGTPSVLLFGPAHPAEWGPPPKPIHRVLWAGRLGNSYDSTPDPGLLELTVEDVWTAVENMLS